MITADEGDRVARCVDSCAGLADTMLVVNTGTEPVDGAVERPWVSFGHNRTEALELARHNADWLLMLDADMTVQAHPDLTQWLNTNPDPNTDAWMVEIIEADITYRLPLLVRGGLEWRYHGVTHEYLDLAGRKTRPLLGLTVTHHTDGANRATKHERDIELLAAGVEAGEPRAVYYTAQALKCLGRNQDAARMYERRAAMESTWEEERWHAEYMAARLREDVNGLLGLFARRPWRHEPLTWAARITAAKGANDDVLFLEAA